MLAATIAFSLAALLLTITPGLDTMFVVRTTMASGPRVGLIGGLGVCLGGLTWAAASAAGVTTLLAASKLDYDVLRIVGAAYLAFIGVRLLWGAHRTDDVEPGWRPSSIRLTAAQSFRTGLFTNLLNPKVGVFYVTLLPQFIPAHVPVFAFSMLLASIHAAETIGWFGVIASAMARVRRWLASDRVRRSLDRLTALVFLGFGARLAFGAGSL
jgi:threonine/homoserine/homoserine lactone efflux protein